MKVVKVVKSLRQVASPYTARQAGDQARERRVLNGVEAPDALEGPG